MDYFTISSIDEIEKLPISDFAKRHIKKLYEFCTALGGSITVTPPQKELDYPFADVSCRLSSPAKFDEIRLSGNGRIEFIGKKWHSLWLHEGHIRPDIVLRFPEQRRYVRYLYLDNFGGIDVVEGNINVKGIRASISESGEYINMEVV